jgi:hypothetical protein
MNRFDKLKAFVAENKSGSRYHKICDGLTRVRVLKNLNEDELDFYSDGYHKIDEVHFVDCEDRKTCPVCAVLRTLWDPNDPEKQRLYREVKRIERHQFQVALLTNDGRDLSKEVAVMITLPKTAMDLILAECLDQGFEPSERDLVIVKKSKGGVYDFT